MAGCKCKNGGKVRNPGCGCGGKVANPRKRRNPVHAASEDYKLGLIQGALERGKLPPPSSSSADLKRGYADGHKVAKAMPAARSEALGVLKATGSHLKAGESLYEAAKGSKNATLSQNPRSSVANVLAGIARKHLDFETLDTRRMDSLDFREVAVWSVKSALEDAYRAGSGGRAPTASLIAGIARKHLYFETLDTRRMGSLDFREVAVWSVKSALEEAYRAGKQAASRGKTSNPAPKDHLKRGAIRFGSAERLLKKGDYFDAIVEASQAKSDFFDGIEADRKDALDGIVFASDLARKAFKSSRGQMAGMPKHRNPARRKSFQSKFIKLLEDIKRAEQAQRDAINEHGYFSPITKEAYKAVGRALDAMDKYREASRGKTSNPMSAAARKHLAHEKSEERSFASLMSKMPQGETVMLGKHRVRKLGKGYVVVDGVRLTTTQAAAKIHRGK